MALAETHAAIPARGRIAPVVAGCGRIIVLWLFCLTPVTALVVLGWLSRKTAHDVATRSADGRIIGGRVQPPPIPSHLARGGLRPDQHGTRTTSPPRLFACNSPVSANFFNRLLGGLFANLRAGIRTWAGALALTLPFSLVIGLSWLAGWENSFNKGYELAGLWPLLSIAGVLLSLPVMAMLPMALAHQSVEQRFRAVFQARRVFKLISLAGWRYLVLTAFIAAGGTGVMAARVLPSFAERLSPMASSGTPEAYAAFSGQFRLITAALLLAGLLLVRKVMAWTYRQAGAREKQVRHGGHLTGCLILVVCSALWLWLAFTVYVAQFFNYAWWNWFNQPLLMLPWIG